MLVRQLESAGATPEVTQQTGVVRPICVVVEHITPPVPSLNFDWMVYEEGQEERGSNFGPTREAALEEFFECREIW